MDDLQIIALYFDRDENAIKETETKYGKLCMRVARNILGNDSDCEECVNDTYLSIWNAIPPERPSNLMAFVCKITRNLSLKRLRFNSTQKRSGESEISLYELEEILPDSAWQPEVKREAVGKLISDFLRTEKADACNVFIRRYWFFDSISDISAMYSFSESKVKSMLYHTRKKLKEHLKKEGVHL